MNVFKEFGRLSRVARVMYFSADPSVLAQWKDESAHLQRMLEEQGPRITFGGMLIFLLGHCSALTETLEPKLSPEALLADDVGEADSAFRADIKRLVRMN